MTLPLVLSIAGSDSSGGAGIQADLKTFTALGVYGLSVVTAVTAQNSQGVLDIFPLPASFVVRQLEAIAGMEIKAVKVGMLATPEIAEAVSRVLKRYEFPHLVVDPVMESHSGEELTTREAIEVLKEKIIPQAEVITPNLLEAEVISASKVRNLSEMKEAALRIHSLGAKFVLIKGGHLKGAAVDLLYDGENFREFTLPRLGKEAHGSGCTFASAVAAELAKGSKVPFAVSKAKEFTFLAIQKALTVGSSFPVANQFRVRP